MQTLSLLYEIKIKLGSSDCPVYVNVKGQVLSVVWTAGAVCWLSISTMEQGGEKLNIFTQSELSVWFTTTYIPL